MNSSEIRNTFLKFFEEKGHKIVPSAPMVVKNDPTLMFTNAGMNQFKDLFLGNAPVKYPRIADTQKCLRVSGKHNDLEEVGVDTYHHTMFEMLGNWSFGDYFKKDAINWAWELLTEVYKIPKDKLYVTVFEGDKKENLDFDQESFDYWKKHIPEERILNGSKKDNFWEMGDTGPCGPCTEIHVDIRDEEEKKKVDGKTLVNNDHPQVIEIWNNVFMEFNRRADGSLEKLPAQHVDTGMGFERLCMVIQGKKSNYDTDVFQDYIQFLSKKSGIAYTGSDSKADIAMRVIADHLRAIGFAIADGQLPSNTGAGYVIRRILRRAVRYGYSFLNFKDPFICELTELFTQKMGENFPEIKNQKELITKVVKEEETAFFRTLEKGIQKFQDYINSKPDKIEGQFAFELYDTYGFPVDLTQLLAREAGKPVDMDGFNKALEQQKERSRAATSIDTEDWIEIRKSGETEFVGYDSLETEAEITRYRKVKAKGKEFFQIVLNRTPFYAEGGGQVGDSGVLIDTKGNSIRINDTKKETGAFIHLTDKLPDDITGAFLAKVDIHKRLLTQNNHSATHLLHAALRSVLGTHVEQKGSLVNHDYLRFDFSHFSKVTDEQIAEIEAIVNRKIREDIPLDAKLLPIEEAKKMGAMALFGEKYGETVRVVTFDPDYSIELCGGTHVRSTGQIGYFKISSEGAVAAGIRRIEAVTAEKAEEFVNLQLIELNELRELLKTKDLKKAVLTLNEEKDDLSKQLDSLMRDKVKALKTQLKNQMESNNGLNIIVAPIELDSAEAVKDLAFQLKGEIDNLFFVTGTVIKGKPNITVMISDNLVKEKNLNAGQIIRELAKEIKGGGGGQAFYATAGGNDVSGLNAALNKAKEFVK
jgi:alanyl-tRNA synthetase